MKFWMDKTVESSSLFLFGIWKQIVAYHDIDNPAIKMFHNKLSFEK